MKILRYLPMLFVVLFSCKEAPERKFIKEGVEITCPKGWKITEEENLSGQGFVLSMEKKD